MGGAGWVWQGGVQQAAVRATGRGTVRVVALLQKDEGMKIVLLRDNKPGDHLVLHPRAPAEPRPRPAPRPHLQLAQPAVAAAAVSADHHLIRKNTHHGIILLIFNMYA